MSSRTRPRVIVGVVLSLAIVLAGCDADADPADVTAGLELASPADATEDVADLVADAEADQVQELADALVAALGERSDTRAAIEFLGEDPARAIVRVDITGDDSVAGFIVDVTMEQRSGTWQVASAERSAICLRGVAEGLCV